MATIVTVGPLNGGLNEIAALSFFRRASLHPFVIVEFHSNSRPLSLAPHSGIVSCIIAAGDTVIAGSADANISVMGIDSKALSLRRTLFGHTHAVASLALCTRSCLLFSASLDGSVRGWSWPSLHFVKLYVGITSLSTAASACHVLTTVPHDDNASGTSLGRVSHHQPWPACACCSQYHRHVLHCCSCRLQLLRCAWRRQPLLRPAEEAALHKRNSRGIVLLHSLQPRDQHRFFFHISRH